MNDNKRATEFFTVNPGDDRAGDLNLQLVNEGIDGYEQKHVLNKKITALEGERFGDFVIEGISREASRVLCSELEALYRDNTSVSRDQIRALIVSKNYI